MTLLLCSSMIQVPGRKSKYLCLSSKNHFFRTLEKDLEQTSSNPPILVTKSRIIMPKYIHARDYTSYYSGETVEHRIQDRKCIKIQYSWLIQTTCLTIKWIKGKKNQKEHKRKNIPLHHHMMFDSQGERILQFT